MSVYTSYLDAVAHNAIVNPVTRIDQARFTKLQVADIDSLEEEDFHIISSEEKKIIFRQHLPTQLAQEIKGRKILDRLQQLAPSIAEHFEVKTDLLEKMTFRLWSQRETDSSHEDSYIALSYCWDTARPPPRPDVKYPLPISPLMFSALASERQWRTTGVWIDQLCIDQDDQEEKDVSVAAMDSVYRCAQFVIVALLDIQVALKQQEVLRNLIKDYETSSPDEIHLHLQETPRFFEKHPEFMRFFYKILESRWFTRAWCSHELELGENFVFYVPCQTADVEAETSEMLSFTPNFLWYMLSLSAEVPAPDNSSGLLRDRLMKKFNIGTRLARVRQLRAGRPTEVEDDSSVQSYTAQIQDMFSLGAGGDPTLSPALRRASAFLDKTSIVLNTLGNGLAVKRNLSPELTEDDYIGRLMLLGLAANDPTVLTTVGDPVRSSSSPSKASWLCKPTYVDLGSGSRRRENLPRMSPRLTQTIRIDTSPSLHWITLDMLALPPPLPPSKEYIALAAALTNKGIELGMGREPAGPLGDVAADYVGKTDLESRLMLMSLDGATSRWGQGPLYQFWHQHTFSGVSRERFNWTLACLLECGKKWTLGMAKKCGYSQPQSLEDKISPFFEKDDFEGIRSMSWADSEAGRDAVNALFSTAAWAVSWGTMLPHKDGEHFMPVLFDHGLHGRAMAFTPTDALVQVVMPSSLLLDEYSRMYRIWLLEAKDDPFYEKMMMGQPAAWFLRGKTILFTDVEAKDSIISEGSAGNGLPGWRFRDSVTVHGPPIKNAAISSIDT